MNNDKLKELDEYLSGLGYSSSMQVDAVNGSTLVSRKYDDDQEIIDLKRDRYCLIDQLTAQGGSVVEEFVLEVDIKKVFERVKKYLEDSIDCQVEYSRVGDELKCTIYFGKNEDSEEASVIGFYTKLSFEKDLRLFLYNLSVIAIKPVQDLPSLFSSIKRAFAWGFGLVPDAFEMSSINEYFLKLKQLTNGLIGEAFRGGPDTILSSEIDIGSYDISFEHHRENWVLQFRQSASPSVSPSKQSVPAEIEAMRKNYEALFPVDQAYLSGDGASVEKMVAKWLEDNPMESGIFLRSALYIITSGNLGLAKPVFKETQLLNDPFFHTICLMTLFNQSVGQKALDYLNLMRENFVKLYPAESNLFHSTIAEIESKVVFLFDKRKAVDLNTKIELFDSNKIRVLSGRSVLAKESGDRSREIEILLELRNQLKKPGKKAKVLERIEELYTVTGRPLEERIEVLAELVQLVPLKVARLNNYVSGLRQLNRFSEAVASIVEFSSKAQASLSNQEKINIELSAGEIFLEDLKQPQSATRHYRSAVELGCAEPVVLQHVFIDLMNSNRLLELERLVNKVISRNMSLETYSFCLKTLVKILAHKNEYSKILNILKNQKSIDALGQGVVVNLIEQVLSGSRELEQYLELSEISNFLEGDAYDQAQQILGRFSVKSAASFGALAEDEHRSLQRNLDNPLQKLLKLVADTEDLYDEVLRARLISFILETDGDALTNQVPIILKQFEKWKLVDLENYFISILQDEGASAPFVRSMIKRYSIQDYVDGVKRITIKLFDSGLDQDIKIEWLRYCNYYIHKMNDEDKYNLLRNNFEVIFALRSMSIELVDEAIRFLAGTPHDWHLADLLSYSLSKGIVPEISELRLVSIVGADKETLFHYHYNRGRELGAGDNQKEERFSLALASLKGENVLIDKQVEAFYEVSRIRVLSNPDLVRLRELIDINEDWDKFLEILESQINLQKDPAVKITILNTVGEIYYSKLDQGESAFKYYKESLAIDREQPLVFLTLADIARKSGEVKAESKAYQGFINSYRNGRDTPWIAPLLDRLLNLQEEDANVLFSVLIARIKRSRDYHASYVLLSKIFQLPNAIELFSWFPVLEWVLLSEDAENSEENKTVLLGRALEKLHSLGHEKKLIHTLENSFFECERLEDFCILLESLRTPSKVTVADLRVSIGLELANILVKLKRSEKALQIYRDLKPQVDDPLEVQKKIFSLHQSNADVSASRDVLKEMIGFKEIGKVSEELGMSMTQLNKILKVELPAVPEKSEEDLGSKVEIEKVEELSYSESRKPKVPKFNDPRKTSDHPLDKSSKELEFNVRTWREVLNVNEVDAHRGIVLEADGFVDDLELHLARQVAFVRFRDKRLIDESKFSSWRDPASYPSGFDASTLYATDLRPPQIASSLFSLVKSLSSVFQELLPQRYYFLESKFVRDVSKEELKDRLVDITSRNSLFSEKVLENALKKASLGGARFFHYPGLGKLVFLDLKTRTFFLDSKYYKERPLTHLLYRILFEVCSYRTKCIFPLRLSPKEAFRFINETSSILLKSGVENAQLKNPKVIKVLKRIDERRLASLLLEVKNFNIEEMSELWRTLKIHLYRIVLAETLDLIGICESIGSINLIEENHQIPKDEKSVQFIEDLLWFSTKLKFIS